MGRLYARWREEEVIGGRRRLSPSVWPFQKRGLAQEPELCCSLIGSKSMAVVEQLSQNEKRRLILRRLP
jgi:hypothetical protein